jgi:sulfoxide reductase heme-binding subunit YedZ
VTVWCFRVLLLTPFVFIAPEVASGVLGRPHGVANLATSGNDVLGTSGMLLFTLMLTVTPIRTVTGCTWHQVLRRDYGLAMFLVALLDLVLSATTTAARFPGGLLTRLGGHAFLLFGTLSTLLLVPVALTANHRAQRWLGRHWKVLHRLVYAAWVTILIHLAFLFGFRSFFLDAVIVSAPLAALRIPGIRAWWVRARRAGTHRAARRSLSAAAVVLFAVGFVPFVIELLHVGTGAFVQHPPA